MESVPHDDSAADLASARMRIAEQEAEIARLRAALDDARRGAELRDAVALAATAGTIEARVTHARLLEMIVETAARVIAARAASLFMVSDDGTELIFEVAIGPRAEEARQFRVPIGQGIAGLVALTGQPMAVADVQNDPRHAAELAEQIGHRPESILCVPLFYDDAVIGVLELLDKIGRPSFPPHDIELLGLFANLAGVAIEQSRARHDTRRLLRDTLGTPEAPEDGFAGAVVEDRAFQDALALARLVREIAERGEAEQRACHALLRGFADYLRDRDAVLGMPGGPA